MERAARDQAALADALATVEQFNSRLAVGKVAWFWPTIAAALLTKHYWLVIACDSCHTITELDLSMKPRDPDCPIRVALEDVRCLRCNGHGRKRIVGLARSHAGGEGSCSRWHAGQR
jgi:hypothetical protein